MAALLAALLVLLVSRRVLADGTFPAEPFNGMQITYQVSGISLGTPVDKHGFGTVRAHPQAKLVSASLRLSGTVVNTWNDDGPAPATMSFVTIRLAAGSVSASQSFDLLGKKAKAFDLELRVPKGATTASFSVSIAGSYGNGESRGLGVSGEAKAKGELDAACTSPKAAAAALAEILRRYNAQIPKGIASSGAVNNAKSLVDDRYQEFVCGGYQAKVLALLDAIRFDEDPCVAALLDDWDYGPIQAWWGGHQAVVIYPRGKDWLDGGLVLDPWMTQRPAAYKVADWGKVWSPASAGSFQGIGPSRAYEGAGYPTHGGVYANPKYGKKLTVAEQALVKALPPDKRKQFDKMSLEAQRAWLARKLREGRTTVIAHCPLEVAITDGKTKMRTGVVDGAALVQLPDVAYLRVPLEDGTWFTQASWPADKDYVASFVGTGKGTADVLVATTSTRHHHFAVDKGTTLSRKGAALIGDLDVPGDVVEEVSWVDDKSALVVPLDHEGRRPSLVRPPRPWVRLAMVAAAGAAVMLLGIVLLARGRRTPPAPPAPAVFAPPSAPPPPAPPARPAPLAPTHVAPPLAPPNVAPASAFAPTVARFAPRGEDAPATRRVSPTLDDASTPASCPRCWRAVPPGNATCPWCGLPLV